MTTLINQTFITLETLLQTCERVQRCFKKAADAIRNQDLKEMLVLHSMQRRRFSEELRPFLCLEPEEFFQLLAIEDPEFPVHDCEAAILRWCIEQDATAIQTYKQTLAMFLPARTQFLIAAQYTMMCRAHEQMQHRVSVAAMGALKTNQSRSSM